MKTALLIVGLAITAGVNLHAQEFVLKDGRHIPFKTFTVSAGTIKVPTELAEGGKMEVSYPLSTVVSINADEPDQIYSAKKLLSENKPNEAIAELLPVLQLYSPVKDMPGQWWAEAALVQANALRVSGDKAGARRIYDDIASSFPPDTRVGALASLRKLSLSEENNGTRLLESINKIADTLKDPDQSTKAELQFLKARALAREDRYREAAEGYLGIRVFYPTVKELQAAATLEAARAFFQMDDLKWTAFYLQDLKASYPNSPELAAAKEDFARLERRQNNPDVTSNTPPK